MNRIFSNILQHSCRTCSRAETALRCSKVVWELISIIFDVFLSYDSLLKFLRYSVKYSFEPKSDLQDWTRFLTRAAARLTSQFLLPTTRCLWPCLVHVDAPHSALHLQEKRETFLWTTWPSPKVDESHLYRFLTQCVSVRLYNLGVSLLRKRESTTLLRQLGSRTPANHSPAERNQSKVDVSAPLPWWMGLTREMMDDQGGHVCFISCRMSYYGNTAAPVTSAWPVSKRQVSHDVGCLLDDRFLQAVQKYAHVWPRKGFCGSIINVFVF